MDDLVQWLRAQLDEDERIARAGGNRWRFEQLRDGPAGEPGGYVLDLGRTSIVDIGFMDDDVLLPDEAAHIAEHDPARVLREVDAKRRIAEHHDRYRSESLGNGPACFTCGPGLGFPCPTMRALALPYADRPGFHEEWRPQ